MARESTNKHLGTASDLTLWAKIKPGFIEDGIENVTFETRLRIVAKALFNARASAREYHLVEPFSDAAARIQAIESFRFAIPEAEPRSVLLAVTFDRPWEPYMRLVWRPLGTFLDLFFHNCVGYPLAATQPFNEYIDWVRRNQVESEFFLSTSGATVADGAYCTQIERLHRESAQSDVVATELIAERPEAVAERIRQADSVSTSEIALEALVVLHRLADYHTPGTKDGDVLLRASRDLLSGWDGTHLLPVIEARFKEQLEWFRGAPRQDPLHDKVPALNEENVQSGILESFDHNGRAPRHGCLLLFKAHDAAGARDFLRSIKDSLSRATSPAGDTTVHKTLGITRHGIELLDLPTAEQMKFPVEFRQGMEKRAGLIGDVRESHPRRWILPQQNWPKSVDQKRPPVDLDEIDFVIQLRAHDETHDGWDALADDHPLSSEVEYFANIAKTHGVRLLSVQSMRRADDDGLQREHFRFVDGISQPRPRKDNMDFGRDAVARGELLRGYSNDRGDLIPSPDKESDYLKDGSFLVIRKMRQDVAGFNRFVEDQAAAAHISADELMGKMMGRRRDGTPMARLRSSDPNDFDFAADPGGIQCPLQAHIRRANPRSAADGRPSPRIMRRGMSYGPPIDTRIAADSSQDCERGTFFMAYCASIAEQFEVIQRWINGGNSTSVTSAQSDPLMGAGHAGQKRVFRFRHNGGVARVNMFEPFATLQWGMYLFVPSFRALDLLCELTSNEASKAAEDEQVEKGSKIISELQSLKDAEKALAWKRCIEDFTSKDPDERADAPAVWAAIRREHGGALKVPYGATKAPGQSGFAVLAASKDLVFEVLTEDETYSVRGASLEAEGPDERMGQSFGHIFLGKNRADGHEAASAEPAKVAGGVSELQAFAVGRQMSRLVIAIIFGRLQAATGKREGKVDLRREYITPALAFISNHWFGFPDGPAPQPGQDQSDRSIAWGGWSWQPAFKDRPHCPGYFTLPSRFIFYPEPNITTRTLGIAQGKAITEAATKFFAQAKQSGSPLAYFPNGLEPFAENDEDLARNVIGFMIGFLPTAEGNLRATLYDWIENRGLWRVQREAIMALEAGALPGDLSPDDHPDVPSDDVLAFNRARRTVMDPLMRAMQKRPNPDVLWRLAVKGGTLGGVTVEPGDLVIAGLASATAEDAAQGKVNVDPIFGGNRTPNGPVHACPGRDFAMGSMLGILSALLECGRIEALPAPLVVRLTDLNPPANVSPVPQNVHEPAAAK